MIKIILVDDHSLFRDGIKSLIHNYKNIRVIGEFDCGVKLIEALKTLEPDIVIMDISMPEMSGIEVTKIINEEFPTIGVIILSMHNTEDFIYNSIKAGAMGYLPKDIRREELLEAIDHVYNGEKYFSKEINNTMMTSFINKAKLENEDADLDKSLTKREEEIIKLVSNGLINKEIAEMLNISIRTVDCHKSNIMQKLKLKSNVDMVKFAIKHNIISLE